jgi:acyl-CoA synthetase (AMP-forming)/AMP-acid ligase II
VTDDRNRESLVDLWFDSCRQHASRILIERGADSWAYGDLFQSSVRVAAWLRANGLVAGGRVMILLENGPEYVASYFGVLAAGGIAVALSPAAGPRELTVATAECEPCATITAHAWAEIAEGEAAGTTFDPVRYPVAQIIYTSGTSGRPKGVTLSHRNLLANTHSILSYLHLSCEDSVLAILPFCHAYGNSLLLTHVAVGGRLVLSDFVFVSRALDVIDQKGVTGFAGVPASFAALLRHSDFHRRTFRSLRYLTCAGGAFAPSLTDELIAAHPEIELHVMYGQTEAAPRLSSLPPSDVIRKRGSVGVAIPAVTLTVRDGAGEVCPANITGEIYASGPNVMDGYWKDAALTADVLRPHGLRTGDLGHMDEEGYLYIDGRSTDLIKSGGYRVHPEEIEAVLQEIDGVHAAAVAGLPDEQWGETITAFVQLRPGVHLETGVIIDYCKRKLPRHKQVRRVVFVGELPKTATGKLVRSRLACRS